VHATKRRSPPADGTSSHHISCLLDQVLTKPTDDAACPIDRKKAKSTAGGDKETKMYHQLPIPAWCCCAYHTLRRGRNTGALEPCRCRHRPSTSSLAVWFRCVWRVCTTEFWHPMHIPTAVLYGLVLASQPIHDHFQVLAAVRPHLSSLHLRAC